jgi:hypothetical protein
VSAFIYELTDDHMVRKEIQLNMLILFGIPVKLYGIIQNLKL